MLYSFKGFQGFVFPWKVSYILFFNVVPDLLNVHVSQDSTIF